MTATGETRHDIFLTEGGLSFHWRLADRGITLTDGHIRWSANGAERDHALSEIASIRLQRAMAGGGNTVGLCLIGFRDGSALNAHGGNSTGIVDETQANAYAAFVHDLHRRLGSDDKRRIAFQAGIAGRRQKILTAAIIGGAALFVVLPIVLFIAVRTWEVFVLMLGALGFAWPAWRNYQTNQPRNYDPSHLPDELL